jgi:uncharacterized protein HemX
VADADDIRAAVVRIDQMQSHNGIDGKRMARSDWFRCAEDGDSGRWGSAVADWESRMATGASLSKEMIRAGSTTEKVLAFVACAYAA